ncbi:LuxR C-terminal-related transcriptional regulator [Pseudooceanicola sp. 200-1SW]|uniref:helix-turn-helix transcriptional regulator n=1 Tax=Pseudooceanicola sp. 200-1SW TaxID=3425949 RepID=UPI003D7FE98D
MLHDTLNEPDAAPGELLNRWHDDVYALWDQLADFEASRAPEARQHLLKTLIGLTGARTAEWVGSARIEEPGASDPMLGWRPRLLDAWPVDPVAFERIRQAIREMEKGDPDQTAVNAARGAGRFRVHSLEELVDTEWFQGRGYAEFYRDIGRSDSLWISIPLCDYAEVHVGLHRGPDQPVFSPRDREIATFSLRGLRWFFRQQMLTEGMGIVPTPLTEAERLVLRGLLDGLSEKAIAEVANQSRHTTHGHVKRIFRKYGVRSRSELMALWLGRGLTQGRKSLDDSDGDNAD